jgi:NAD(P) transhydrogenase
MSEDVDQYDVVVVGSGPGGEGAAMQAVKSGLSVVMIEKNKYVGGNCTHFGTIPSKTLRHAAQCISGFQRDTLFNRIDYHSLSSFPELISKSESVVNMQVNRRRGHYFRNNIKILNGAAVLKSSSQVNVEFENGEVKEVFAKNIILATGSRPYRPQMIDFNNKRITDSDTILSLKVNPKSIVIYGAGVIGCEYTSIFKSLGAKVTLLNTRDSLLSFLDEDIVDALSYHFREEGVLIRHQERCLEVVGNEDFVSISLESGKNIVADVFLVAMGREGVIEELNLEGVGIVKKKRNYIVVNEFFQTSVPNVYAVGDLTGFPCLASAAYDQGRFAAMHILNPSCDQTLLNNMPIGIYTSPEISCIGATEKELRSNKVPYEIGHVSFKNLARSQISGETSGMLKILFHVETTEILGIHCFGQHASEIIHIGQAIMAQKHPANSIKYFVNTTFNYPTMAEAYRVAALNGLNRLKS